MSKTTSLPIRFPNEILDRVNVDAKTLRRSKASIVIEILEKHYHENPRRKKLAGQR
jgi:predicted DNA-binding protein